MARKGWRAALAAGVSVCWMLGTETASASGPSAPAPHYIDQFGGDLADLKQVWNGRIGVVMGRSPRPELYMKWRLLHGWPVGPDAGAALSKPCCEGDGPGRYEGWDWVMARKLVPGAPEIRPWPDLERQIGDGVSVLNCYDDALATAKATLKDRVGAYGANDPAVRAWLATQDAVFAACSSDKVQLPPLPANAPAWLQKDRAYQEAAFALYMGREEEAAKRFRAISADATSPWQGSATYLVARALWRNALEHPGAASEAEAVQALARLAVAAPGTFGQSQAQPLREALAARLHPDQTRARLEALLAHPETSADLAARFRDLTDISDTAVMRGGHPSEMLDWMATFKGQLPKPPGSPVSGSAQTSADASNGGSVDYATYLDRWRVKRLKEEAAEETRVEAERREALAHAVAFWKSGRDPVWLIAAMSLANPTDGSARALIAESEKIRPTYPGWLTLQHHLIRLTRPAAAIARVRLDKLLARDDLTTNERNLFRAERTQVASDLDDFMVYAMRRRICADASYDTCPRYRWSSSEQSVGVFDGPGRVGTLGLGEDAMAVLDRMPLAMRMRAGDDAHLPPRLRLDLELTSFARAVDLQNRPAIDELSAKLERLLPAMAADFETIREAASATDKRFAEFFVLAKIPGLRTDLIEYTRPEGSVDQYQGYWSDWVLLAKGHHLSSSVAPEPYRYQESGQGADEATPEAHTDLTCLGECGIGAEPLRLPGFVAKAQAEARAERAYFLRTRQTYYAAGKTNPPLTAPPGAVSVWDEMLAYVAAHPKDPRAPEALYWLVHVGHFGGSHNHSGRRAFRLLKTRYASSPWAAKVSYYYD